MMLQKSFAFILAFTFLTGSSSGMPAASQCQCKADILFIVDSSSAPGFTYYDYRHQLDFIAGLSSQFVVGPNDVQFAALVYCNSAVNNFGFDTYLTNSQVHSALAALPFTGGPRRTGNALRQARMTFFAGTNGARSGVAKVAIVVMHGGSDNFQETANQAQQLKATGVIVVAIGVGVSRSNLEAIASSDDLVHTASSFHQLAVNQSVVANDICAASNQLLQCQGSADILFILDSSGTVGPQGYSQETNFVADVILNIPNGILDVRYAVLAYSSSVVDEIGFNDFSSITSLTTEIRNLPYYGYTTRTGLALESAREFSFTSANGARPNVGKIAVVITDGLSTDTSNTVSEAFLLKMSGVTVISIGVGITTQAAQTELLTIASSPSLVFHASSFDVLDDLTSQLVSATCFVKQQQQVNTDCIVSSCVGRQDGDYPACDPECRQGIYYSCVSEHTYLRPCQTGPYLDANHNLYYAPLVFNVQTGKCEGESPSCPRDARNYQVTVPTTATPVTTPSSGGNTNQCFNPSDTCAGRPDGNYAKCFPACQDGFFYTCTNGETVEMPCSQGTYYDDNGDPFTARKVYDPATDSCELTVAYCPRTLTSTTNPTMSTDPDPPDGNNCTGKADIVFILDSSGSVGYINYAIQAFFAADLTRNFIVGPNDFQFGAIVFSTDFEIPFYLNTYQNNNDVFNALLMAPYRGLGTKTDEALAIANVLFFSPQQGARDNVARIAIVITDGISFDPNATATAAQFLKDNGVTIIAIGVGPQPRDSELQAIASSPSHVFTVNNYDVLNTIRNQVITVTCEDEKSFSTCILNSCKNRLDGNYPACDTECRDGYYYSCANEIAHRMPCPIGKYYDSQGNSFNARLVFDAASGTCEPESDSCPRDPTNYGVTPPTSTTVTTSQSSCITTLDDCHGRADGDYPVCYPYCQNGYYVSCTNGEAVARTCANGLYTDTNNNQFQAVMVFDPATGTCQLSSTNCPRTVQNTGGGTVITDPVPNVCDTRADVLFILDSSRGIGRLNFYALTAFAAELSTYFNVGLNNVRIAALTYSHNVYLEFSFTRHNSSYDVWRALYFARYYGSSSNTAFALSVARQYLFNPSLGYGARRNVPHIAIVITDGVSSNANSTATQATLLKESGVTVISVGIGIGARQSELEAIASPGLAYRVDNFLRVGSIQAQLVASACIESCISNSQSCQGRNDGNYPACDSECRQGFFYSCVNQYARQMPCPTAMYNDTYGDQFTARLVYNPDTDVCERETDACPRDPIDYALSDPPTATPSLPPAPPTCLISTSSCSGNADGNYAFCGSRCEEGDYITCIHGNGFARECPSGYFEDSQHRQFMAKLVYDPSAGTCIKTSDSCPRTLTYPDPDPDPPTSPVTVTEMTPPNCEARADIVFILDSSGSIGQANFSTAITFASDISLSFNVGPDDVHFGAIVFSDAANEVFGLAENLNNVAVTQALSTTAYLTGGTNTAIALELARTRTFQTINGARSNVPQIAIVITDGLSGNTTATIEQADLLKAIGVTIISIGVGSSTDPAELEAIASASNLLFQVSDFSVLEAVRSQLISRICTDGTGDNCIQMSCSGRSNGNYRACDPECREGFYYTCTNGLPYRQECPFGTYLDASGNLFQARTVFDPVTGRCQETSSSCPRDPTDCQVTIRVTQAPTTTPETQQNECLWNTDDCSGRPSGDYELCAPECQTGYYITCSNGFGNQMPCPLEFYSDSAGSFTARMVFNKIDNCCEKESPSCPRNPRAGAV